MSYLFAGILPRASCVAKGGSNLSALLHEYAILLTGNDSVPQNVHPTVPTRSTVASSSITASPPDKHSANVVVHPPNGIHATSIRRSSQQAEVTQPPTSASELLPTASTSSHTNAFAEPLLPQSARPESDATTGPLSMKPPDALVPVQLTAAQPDGLDPFWFVQPLVATKMRLRFCSTCRQSCTRIDSISISILLWEAIYKCRRHQKCMTPCSGSLCSPACVGAAFECVHAQLSGVSVVVCHVTIRCRNGSAASVFALQHLQQLRARFRSVSNRYSTPANRLVMWTF